MFGTKGDEGTSINPHQSDKRISKNAPIMNILGELDELVAVIGVAKEYVRDFKGKNLDCVLKDLMKIQKSLIDLSFFISTFKNELRETYDLTYNLEDMIKLIEAYISAKESDNVKKGLHLIITYGGKCSTHLYYARAVCRRFERSFVNYMSMTEGPLFVTNHYIPTILAFINRLGDYLFFLTKDLSDETEVYYS